jgi:hypothetical protein
MKSIIITSFLALAFAACNQVANKNASSADSTVMIEHHHDSAATNDKTVASSGSSTTTPNPSIAESNQLATVYNPYFDLKNALAKDDGKAAQTAGKSLFDNITKIQSSTLSAGQSAIWTKYKAKLSFDAEHISSVDELEHQREHFASLSKNMFEVIKAIKIDKPVYYQHCPMYGDGKSGNWLSLEKKIKNPYFGKSMPTCGTIVETIQ